MYYLLSSILKMCKNSFNWVTWEKGFLKVKPSYFFWLCNKNILRERKMYIKKKGKKTLFNLLNRKNDLTFYKLRLLLAHRAFYNIWEIYFFWMVAKEHTCLQFEIRCGKVLEEAALQNLPKVYFRIVLQFAIHFSFTHCSLP